MTEDTGAAIVSQLALLNEWASCLALIAIVTLFFVVIAALVRR